MVFEFLSQKKHDEFKKELEEIKKWLKEFVKAKEEEIKLDKEFVDPFKSSGKKLRKIIDNEAKDVLKFERGLLQRFNQMRQQLHSYSEMDAKNLNSCICTILTELEKLRRLFNKIEEGFGDNHFFYHCTPEFEVDKNNIDEISKKLDKLIDRTVDVIDALKSLRKFQIEVYVSSELIKRYKGYRNGRSPLKDYCERFPEFPYIIDEMIRWVIKRVTEMKKSATMAFETYKKADLRGYKRNINPHRFSRIIFLTDRLANLWVYDVTTTVEHNKKSGRYFDIYTGKINKSSYRDIKNFKRIYETIKEVSEMEAED